MAESPVVYNLDGGSSGNGNCGNGMFGGGWDAWIVIILFALIFGNNWGNRGNGGGDSMAYIPYLASSVNASGALTRADLCQDMNFQSLENGVRGIQQGLCDGFYAMNTGIMQGFHGVDNAICTLGYNNAQLANNINMGMMQGFNSANVVALQNQNALQTQLAQCCCDQKAATADLKYTIASEDCATRNLIQSNTRDIVDATNAGTRAILDYLCQEKISDLQNENQALRLSASQTAQNQYLISQLRPFPVASYQVPNPFTGAYGAYQGYGCGCNAGCGC